MKAAELVSVWSSPDNTRLTAKQASFRLPVHVAAKIAALCDMYPHKSRTQIVGDLLATALLDVEKALPCFQGERCHASGAYEDDGTDLFFAVGPAVHFRNNTNRHYEQLEKELGVENPPPFYTGELMWSE